MLQQKEPESNVYEEGDPDAFGVMNIMESTSTLFVREVIGVNPFNLISRCGSYAYAMIKH